MNSLLLAGGLATMCLSAGATLFWLQERDLAAMDHSHLTDFLGEDGRVALEGRSFRSEASATPAGPAASSVPRGLPSDPDAPPADVPTGMGAVQHGQGQHDTARSGSELAPPVQGDDGVYAVDFAHLLFTDYDPPELRSPEEPNLAFEKFPKVVQDLNGEEIAISGFMIAVDWKDRKIERFLLGRFPPGCCYGMVPLFDEWIEVDNRDAGSAEYSAYETLTVRGTFEAGELLDDEGYVLSLYRLKATAVRPLY